MRLHRTTRFDRPSCRLAAGLGLSVLALLSVSCGTVAADGDVRAVLERFEQAVEDRDLETLAGLVSNRYAGDRTANREQLLALVADRLAGSGPIHLLVIEKKLELPDAGTADVELLVALAQVPLDSVLNLDPSMAELGHVRLTLESESGDWKLTGASWTDALPNDFL